MFSLFLKQRTYFTLIEFFYAGSIYSFASIRFNSFNSHNLSFSICLCICLAETCKSLRVLSVNTSEVGVGVRLPTLASPDEFQFLVKAAVFSQSLQRQDVSLRFMFSDQHVKYWMPHGFSVDMTSSVLLALLSRLSENGNSYKCTLFPTSLFVANLLKHFRSCQTTG